MKYLILIMTFSIFLQAQETGQYVSRLDSSLHDGYKESECYAEFNEVYNRTVRSAVNELKFKQNIALTYGVTLSGSSSSSDFGKEERSIALAADYIQDGPPGYLQLNNFHEIHTKAQDKHPEITREQTQMLIRKGFQSGQFCDGWFFSNRYGTNAVARYVKKEFEKYLEEEQGREPAISDSEIPKEESEEEMNRELQYDEGDGRGAGEN